MPSLQELLQRIEEQDKALGQALRALLEGGAEMHAKDKAEIERLRKRNKALAGQSSLLNEVICAQEVDAEIGRLVRGMRLGGNLTRPVDGWIASDYANYKRADNPTEALRAIQKEVGDA